MLNAAALVLPEVASHAAHLLAYQELTLLRPSVIPSAVWRTLAERIAATTATCPRDLQAAYQIAYVSCIANAADQTAVYCGREPAPDRNVARAIRNAYRPETVLQWVPTVTEVA